MMTSSNLTVDGELRYIVQWFNEWSELQREDFLPILSDYLSKDAPEVYMNGVVSAISVSNINDKPMSLFQCRIKLFKEWSAKWPENIKSKLKEKIIEIDASFEEKLQKEMSTVVTNGTVDVEPESVAQIEEQPEDVPVTEIIAQTA